MAPNCGVGASDLLAAILGMKPGGVLIAKANAGVPQWHGAEIHYSGTPELMERYAGLAADCGARIVGGCCGNTPEHVEGDAPGPRRPQARAHVRTWRRSSRRSDPLSRRRRRRPAPVGSAGGSVREFKGEAARLELVRPRAMRSSWKTCPSRRRARSPLIGARRAAGLRRRRGERRRAAGSFPGPGCGRKTHRAIADPTESPDRGRRRQHRRTRRPRRLGTARARGRGSPSKRRRRRTRPSRART